MPKCSLEGVYARRVAERRSAVFRCEGTERRKRTGVSRGAARAEMTVFAVMEGRSREVARATSSAWYSTFSVMRGS